MRMIYESFKPEDTFAIGEKIGREAKPGMLCTLTGDLLLHRVQAT